MRFSGAGRSNTAPVAEALVDLMHPVLPVFLRLAVIFFGILLLFKLLLGNPLFIDLHLDIFLAVIIGGLVSLFQVALNRSEPRVDLNEDEVVLDKQLCVHGKPWSDAGGWLFLTNHNLQFVSHRYSSRKRKLSIRLDTIEDAFVEGTKKLFVKSVDKDREMFTLRDATRWKDQIIESTRPG